MNKMAKVKVIYSCYECGYETNKWLGRCTSCGSFNSFVEKTIDKKAEKKAVAHTLKSTKPMKLDEITTVDTERVKTNFQELNRVLSGGLVQGSLTLVGGDPGIGKSTLLLQICQSICEQDKLIIYISGEESIQQIKLRATRLNINSDNLLIMAETSMSAIESTIKEYEPDLVIIDSIQTIYTEELNSSPGSVTQTRESVSKFMKIAKGDNISIIVVGHVTKEGNLAGPKMLEHMVDTVIYFEGDKNASYRLIRTVKNRFGATNEIGVFEMCEGGLAEITNPSEYMLAGRPINIAGSVITCSIEGTRPILTEVQSLVSVTNFGMPRRTANGMDYNRVVMLMAVLEKRAGMQLSNYDSYVNIAGGMKIIEPSLDVAVVSAIASSYKNKPINPYTIVFGEVGLTGEIRAVTNVDKRVKEAKKLGFKNCIIPQANLKGLEEYEGMRVFGVSNIGELLKLIFNE